MVALSPEVPSRPTKSCPWGASPPSLCSLHLKWSKAPLPWGTPRRLHGATQRQKCSTSPEAHPLEPRSMPSEYLTARLGAAHNGYTWSLTTGLHFQGCLGGLIYALHIKPSAMMLDPVCLHGGQFAKVTYPWVLRGTVNFPFFYLFNTFTFINSSVLLLVLSFSTVYLFRLWYPIFI